MKKKDLELALYSCLEIMISDKECFDYSHEDAVEEVLDIAGISKAQYEDLLEKFA